MGGTGWCWRFVLSVAFNFGTYFFSDKIALRMYNAQPVTREQLPRAYAAVERLTAKQGLPMPKIYVLPTESPNAFATGRNPQHASVAVTHGILQLLDDEELEGVLAHELGHVKNRDILTSSIAATLAGAITMVARMGYWASLFGGYGGGDRRERSGGGLSGLLMIIVAPIAASLIQLGSRGRGSMRRMRRARLRRAILMRWRERYRSWRLIRSGFRWRLRLRMRICSLWLRCSGAAGLRVCSRRILR